MNDEDIDNLDSDQSSCSVMTLLIVNRLVKELTAIESENVTLEQSEYLRRLNDHLILIEKEVIGLFNELPQRSTENE